MKRAKDFRAARTSLDIPNILPPRRAVAPSLAMALTLAALADSASGHPMRPLAPARAGPDISLAHAIVVRTSPQQNGVTADAVTKVEVWYDAGIRDAFAALAVIGASGERVDKRDAAIDKTDPSHVSVSVDPLGPGKYTARYRALSADGHLVSGAWEFEVRR